MSSEKEVNDISAMESEMNIAYNGILIADSMKDQAWRYGEDLEDRAREMFLKSFEIAEYNIQHLHEALPVAD